MLLGGITYVWVLKMLLGDIMVFWREPVMVPFCVCVCVCVLGGGGGRRNTAFGERNDAFYASSDCEFIYKFSEL